MSDLEKLAMRLREEPGFSRNRRFDELSRPESRRLLRQLRRLDGLVREAAAADEVSLHPEGDGFRLTLGFHAVRARRETRLTAAEHALLHRLGWQRRAAAVAPEAPSQAPSAGAADVPEADGSCPESEARSRRW